MEIESMPENVVPKNDGDVGAFVTPEILKPEVRRWFDGKRSGIFINGMLVSGEEHKKAAEALSDLQMCKIIGVYNKSEGGFKDFVQCVHDKYQFHGPGAPSAEQESGLMALLAWMFLQEEQLLDPVQKELLTQLREVAKMHT